MFRCWPLGVSTFGGEGEVGIQPMNKFEQLSSDDHQMSVAGGGVGYLLCDPSHDPCDIYLSPYEQIDACENITFPQLHLRAVKIKSEIMFIYPVLTFKQSDDKSLNLKPRSTVGTHELQVYNNFFQKNV